MTAEFEILNEENNKDDILNLINRNPLINCYQYPMFKIYDALNSLYKILADYGLGSRKFIDEGVPCEFLKLGSPKWRKGRLKVKLVIEFYPDEPESPLDEIRQMAKESEQQ